MKKTINAQIVADSINQMGDRITTYLLTYPRFIHPELMTHRVFSRNSASSRAIPFEKMVKMVKEDPFIPIAWQKDHKGMQGSEYITDQKIIDFKSGVWLQARNEAINRAKELNSNLSKYKSIDDYEELEGTGVTKQLCNRLLEPFMWHTVLVTATEWNNFFELRCPKYKDSLDEIYKSKKDYLKETLEEDQYKSNIDLDWYLINKSQAEIHIQTLAESMWDAKNESTPKILRAGEWHIPFGDKIVEDDLLPILYKVNAAPGEMAFQKVKIATARCARLSYMTFDGEIDYEKDIKLHDKLLLDIHMSPFEHCAKAMNEKEYFSFIKGEVHFENNVDYITIVEENPSRKIVGWCNNFKGFIPYRYMIENNINI